MECVKTPPVPVKKPLTPSSPVRSGHTLAPQPTISGGCVNECRSADSRDDRHLHRPDSGGFRRLRAGSEMGGRAVTQNLIGLALAVAIAVFLFAALLYPERF